VLAPSRTVWLFDNAQRAAVAGPRNLHRTAHRSAANVLFLDGGVRRVSSASAGSASSRGNGEEILWNP
jgi:prepilin-type processing-associated H-X9-DG protein